MISLNTKKEAREKREKLQQIEQRKKEKETKQVLKNGRENRKPKTLKKFENGDFVVVEYEMEKFPGIITKVIIEKNVQPKFEVKTMTMSGSNWCWPNKDDILIYDASEILKKIKPPIPFNRRGIFSVPDFN